MRQPGRVLAGLAAVCSLALPVRADPSAAWELSIAARQHSDALPLSRWGDDDFAAALRPRNGRNLAYLDHEVSVSRNGEWGRWSLLSRQSATLIASPGAIGLAAAAQSPGGPVRDQSWPVEARYLAFAGSGLAWQQGWSPAPGWCLQGGVQALVLRRWRERQIEGDAAYNSADGSYQARLSSFEASERLAFPYQGGFAGQGLGVLFDGELRWSDERVSARVGWRDVGRLRWSGLPQNLSRLSTDTRGVDDGGFVVYQPLIQGQNSQSTRRRAGPARALAFIGWRVGEATRFEAGAERLRHFGVLPQARVEHGHGEWRFGLAWHAHERRASASVAWRGLQLKVGADRPGAQMRSRELVLAGSWPL